MLLAVVVRLSQALRLWYMFVYVVCVVFVVTSSMWKTAMRDPGRLYPRQS